MLAKLMECLANITQEIINLLGKDGSLRFHVVGLELWARIFLAEKRQLSWARGSLLSPAHDSRRLTRRPDREKPESPLAGLVRCTFGRLGN
jgi:hypothetical protein